MSSYQKKQSKKGPSTENSTSFYTSNLEPIQEEKTRKKDKTKKKANKEPVSERDNGDMSDRSIKRGDEKERPSSKSKLDKTNKLSASFRSGSVAFRPQKGISPYR